MVGIPDVDPRTWAVDHGRFHSSHLILAGLTGVALAAVLDRVGQVG